jgi:hypothetical protein
MEERINPVFVKDAVWRYDYVTIRCLDSENSCSIFLNVPLKAND